jgi:hypothetical protein
MNTRTKRQLLRKHLTRKLDFATYVGGGGGIISVLWLHEEEKRRRVMKRRKRRVTTKGEGSGEENYTQTLYL